MFNKIKTKLKRRPFPLNLEALRACRVSYAHTGEDLFLTTLLGYEKTDGIYVDVGCFRPIEFSNTYIFYERGWRGIAIDPNPGLKPEWDHYRAEDTFLNFAISKERKKMVYLINKQYAAMNTVVDEDEVSRFDPAQYTVSSCESIPLTAILEQHLKGNRIDLLNVDCEGRDFEVLSTLDFQKYRPHVIAVEDRDISLQSRTAEYLLALNYQCRAYIGLTKIFQNNS
jgi:FkbM family methyltransferase